MASSEFKMSFLLDNTDDVIEELDRVIEKAKEYRNILKEILELYEKIKEFSSNFPSMSWFPDITQPTGPNWKYVTTTGETTVNVYADNIYGYDDFNDR